MLLAQKAQLTNTFVLGFTSASHSITALYARLKPISRFSRRDQSDTIPGVQWERSFGIANDSYDSSGLGSWFMDGWKKGLEMIFFPLLPLPIHPTAKSAVRKSQYDRIP